MKYILAALLIIGVLLSGIVLHQTDRMMRKDMVRQVRLVVDTINRDAIQALIEEGPRQDVSPLLARMALSARIIRSTDPHWEGLFVAGRDRDGCPVYIADTT